MYNFVHGLIVSDGIATLPAGVCQRSWPTCVGCFDQTLMHVGETMCVR